MNNNQVKDLFIRIKALYPTFSANQDVKNEWIKWLKDYSSDGVNRNLTKWYEEHPNDIPTIINLINEFIRIKSKDRYLACKYCKESFKEDDLDKLRLHEDRHRSVNYIKKKEHLLNKDYDEKQLMEMNQEDFDKAYDRFLELIYEKEEDSKEKDLLAKCISKEANEFEVCEVM